jgi:uncharacterized protein (UPF0218 family)
VNSAFRFGVIVFDIRLKRENLMSKNTTVKDDGINIFNPAGSMTLTGVISLSPSNA